METPKTGTYDAQGEYLKDFNRSRRPGNIPASLMRQAQHSVIEALQNNVVMKASMHPGFSQRVEKWNKLSKDEKYLAAADLRDEDEVKAAIIVEDDTDIIRLLSDKIDEFRAANEAKS